MHQRVIYQNLDFWPPMVHFPESTTRPPGRCINQDNSKCSSIADDCCAPGELDFGKSPVGGQKSRLSGKWHTFVHKGFRILNRWWLTFPSLICDAHIIEWQPIEIRWMKGELARLLSKSPKYGYLGEKASEIDVDGFLEGRMCGGGMMEEHGDHGHEHGDDGYEHGLDPKKCTTRS